MSLHLIEMCHGCNRMCDCEDHFCSVCWWEIERLEDMAVVRVLGTATTPEAEERRAWMATDWLTRTFAPAWLDLAGLRPTPDRRGDDVLNGIAYDESGDRLFVTGKLWPQLYEIRIRR